MYLTNQFSIPSSIDKAWDTLLTVTEIVDCVPGAKLTEVVSETSWKGSLDVSLGAIHLTFNGTVELKKADVEGRTILFWAQGQEARGRGVAQGTVTSHLWEAEGKTLASVYSPRPSQEAGVSMPVRWEEVKEIYPSDFTILTACDRIAKIGDLWAGILDAKHDLAKLLDTITGEAIAAE